jgi:succinoglycan biosynthesis protein ExoO
VVTVVVPTFNAVRHVEAAVQSALKQSLSAIEVVIVDDCSTDETMAMLAALRQADTRVRIDRLPQNSGPGAARNRALALAQGRYAAILDSDDMIAPDRLARMVAVAEREGADIVADNLVLFDSDDLATAAFFLDPRTPPGWISREQYLGRTIIHQRGADLGYLKPLLRLEALRGAGIGYDEQLRIAEDDNLIVRLLLAGKRYWLEPEAGYAYRRHAASTSHRLSVASCEAMVAANAAVAAGAAADLPVSVRRALARRQQALVAALGFERLVAALKGGKPFDAAAVAVSCPACLPLLRMPIAARLRRLTGGSGEVRRDEGAIAALARIIGPVP